MSHFARIDQNNIVLEVIVAEQDFIDTGVLGDPASFVQTSYHNNIRKNFAGIGMLYDEVRDAFISPKRFPSFILNETTCIYEPPVAYPQDGKSYVWNEDLINWVEG